MKLSQKRTVAKSTTVFNTLAPVKYVFGGRNLKLLK